LTELAVAKLLNETRRPVFPDINLAEMTGLVPPDDVTGFAVVLYRGRSFACACDVTPKNTTNIVATISFFILLK
jgi:hypothetical protein